MMDCDVLVVGAGPGGSSAASKLAKNGLKTIIIDKKDFPRVKPCGNLISGYCLSLLDEKIPDEIIRCNINSATVEYKHKVKIDFENPIGVFVERYDFDNHLLKCAISNGAEFLAKSKVDKIEKKEEKTVTTLQSGEKICSKFVVGADGATGATSRYVRKNKYKKWEQCLAFYCEIPRKHFMTDFSSLEEGIYVDVKTMIGGYAWFFSEGPILNVGLGSSLLLSKGLRKKFDSYIQDRLLDKQIKFCGKAHPLPIGGIPRTVAKDGVLLIGDAAGSIDPVSGEGIGFAVHSGQLAASAIMEGKLHEKKAQAIYKKLYKKYIAKEVRPLLLFAGMLLVLRPIFFALTPTQSEKILRRQFEAVAGRMKHRQFVKEALCMLPKAFICSLFQRLTCSENKTYQAQK